MEAGGGGVITGLVNVLCCYVTHPDRWMGGLTGGQRLLSADEFNKV